MFVVLGVAVGVHHRQKSCAATMEGGEVTEKSPLTSARPSSPTSTQLLVIAPFPMELVMIQTALAFLLYIFLQTLHGDCHPPALTVCRVGRCVVAQVVAPTETARCR